MMPAKAKIYVALVVIAGIALLGAAGLAWKSADPMRYLGVLLLAVLASTRKVRLPKTTSNISIGFLFILMGIAEFSFSEAVILAGVTALVQSLWNRQPKLVQMLFNVSALGISAAAAYWAADAVLRSLGMHSHLALMGMSTCIFFVLDTGLVAGVLSLTEGQPLEQVWQQCCLWAFPYYLVGAGVAALVAASSHAVGWKGALLVLPLMYMIYLYYRMYVERTGHQEI